MTFGFVTIYQSPIHEESQQTEIISIPYINTDKNVSTFATALNLKLSSHHLVLLWTNLFNEYHWHQDAFFNSSTIISCSPTHHCKFTRDQSKLSQASLVAFHLYDIDRYHLPHRTKSKLNNQTWILVTGESPVNFYYQNPSFSPYVLDDQFNQVISYKAESPYPIFIPKMKHQISFETKSNLSVTLLAKIQRELNFNSIKLKKKSVVWIVSNCVTFSQREKYVEQLKQFIDVDIYGKCAGSCSKKYPRECHVDLDQYYFYLAFENSRCNSYITEKFWKIVSDKIHRLVPVVMGANENDYKQIAPRQSFIHVNNYKSSEDLAKYLHYLISNPDKYLEYLQWREHTTIEMPDSERWMTLLCPLCQMAHETPINAYKRLNLSSWYNPKTECHPDDWTMLRKCKQTNLRMWMNRIHNIKCP